MQQLRRLHPTGRSGLYARVATFRGRRSEDERLLPPTTGAGQPRAWVSVGQLAQARSPP